jgi:glycosyltransferase involved in cell wall biosynthesis
MVAADICSQLDRSIFNPLILFMYQAPGLMPEILSNRNIATYKLNQTRVKRLFGPLLSYKALVGLKIDLLHVHHVPLWQRIWKAAKLAKIPVVLTEHAKFSISRSNKLQKTCRKAAGEVNCFTAVSKDLKDYLVKEIGIPGESITVIPNGVDISRFVSGSKNGVLEDLLPDKFDGKVLISVGRLTEAKDQITLLSAIELLKKRGRNIFLIVVGDGEMRILLEKEIAQKDLIHCVYLAGSRSDVYQLLPGADAFILSSKREGFPMSILEAMAAGLPVIASNVGGIPEIVKDGENGILIPPQDQNSLANAICRVIDDPGFAADLANRARITVEQNYSIQAITEAYTKIYISILKRNPA